jgi:hypothetical protein
MQNVYKVRQAVQLSCLITLLHNNMLAISTSNIPHNNMLAIQEQHTAQ